MAFIERGSLSIQVAVKTGFTVFQNVLMKIQFLCVHQQIKKLFHHLIRAGDLSSVQLLCQPFLSAISVCQLLAVSSLTGGETMTDGRYKHSEVSTAVIAAAVTVLRLCKQLWGQEKSPSSVILKV